MELSLGRTYQANIRDDSVATIRSLGLLGDKYVEITLGSENAPMLPDGAAIKSQDTVDYYQVADEARETFRRANEIAKTIIDVLSQLDKATLVKNLNSAAAVADPDPHQRGKRPEPAPFPGVRPGASEIA